MFKLCPSPGRAVVNAEDQPGSPEIEDESALDGEVGRRLNQMFSVPVCTLVFVHYTTEMSHFMDYE